MPGRPLLLRGDPPFRRGLEPVGRVAEPGVPRERRHELHPDGPRAGGGAGGGGEDGLAVDEEHGAGDRLSRRRAGKGGSDSKSRAGNEIPSFVAHVFQGSFLLLRPK